ncbi:MAG: cytochrome o ubiquinol oxidase subunit IV [Coxiellaceae bacterium]|nr:cytochrome o ubiquinol oxidase subunit IV [Coxiellaceae bacterium]
MSKTTKIRFGAKPKTLPSYIVGLFLSLLFTTIAFYCVEKHDLSVMNLYIVITGLAVLQLLAQVICFLRLNTTREGQWNTLPFLFTLIVVGVLMSGSLWIMWNLNYNMMN